MLWTVLLGIDLAEVEEFWAQRDSGGFQQNSGRNGILRGGFSSKRELNFKGDLDFFQSDFHVGYLLVIPDSYSLPIIFTHRLVGSTYVPF